MSLVMPFTWSEVNVAPAPFSWNSVPSLLVMVYESSPPPGVEVIFTECTELSPTRLSSPAPIKRIGLHLDNAAQHLPRLE